MKRASIRFSELAVADILEQADWYEIQAGPKLATRWDRAVTSTVVRISTAPGSGALCRFKAEQLQDTRRIAIAGFPKHLIFYRVEATGILVLRVVHGARDLESLFSARPSWRHRYHVSTGASGGFAFCHRRKVPTSVAP